LSECLTWATCVGVSKLGFPRKVLLILTLRYVLFIADKK
jgi:hypothetical protein